MEEKQREQEKVQDVIDYVMLCTRQILGKGYEAHDPKIFHWMNLESDLPFTHGYLKELVERIDDYYCLKSKVKKQLQSDLNTTIFLISIATYNNKKRKW